MTNGITATLHFHDGKPEGIIAATLDNWTGNILVTPRVEIEKALCEEVAQHTGIYMLVGENADKPMIYLGEAENIEDRIRRHGQEKDWWVKAILITSKSNDLDIADAKYLEARLLTKAKEVGNADLNNKRLPNVPRLERPKQAALEKFLENLDIVLPALRCDYFVDNRRSEVSRKSVGGEQAFEISLKEHGIAATARIVGGEFIVQKESGARYSWESKNEFDHAYAKLHSKLVEKGVLVPVQNSKNKMSQREFASDYKFSSVSAAAAVIHGYPVSGPKVWKVQGMRKSYKQWEKERIQLGQS